MSDKAKVLGADQKRKRIQGQILIVGIILIACIICHFCTGGKLLSPINLKVLSIQWTYPLLIGLGMMFIFSGGMVDLSIGAQAILAGNIGAILVEDFGLGYPGLILGCIGGVIICEMVSASCSVFFGIPSWVAGLGSALVFEAIATIICSARTGASGSAVVYLKNCRILGSFPWIILIAAIVFAVAYFLFNQSKLGLNLQAVGSAPEVSEAMGINRRKTIMIAALVGAIIVGVGTTTQLSYTGRYTAMSGMGSLAGIFKSLAAILTGQSFGKYFSNPMGVLVGSFIVTVLFNILTLFGVPSGTYQEMTLGAVVILCGILASWKIKGVVK